MFSTLRMLSIALFGALIGFVGLGDARAGEPVFQLCKSRAQCGQATGGWWSQKLLGWELRLPKAALSLGQEVRLHLPAGVSAMDLKGNPLPGLLCKGRCVSARVGQLILLARLAAPKSRRLQQVWMVSGSAQGLSKSSARKLREQFRSWQWSPQLKAASARKIGLRKDLLGALDPSAASLASLSSARGSQGSTSAANAFIADLTKIAKSRAKERVFERVKSRICRKLCACGKKGKRSLLPQTCKGLLKHKLLAILRRPQTLRQWLRADLFGFLKAQVDRSLKGHGKAIQKILMEHVLELMKTYLTHKAAPYELRRQLQQSVSAMLSQLLDQLQTTPQLELVLRITTARLQQCLASGKPCRFDLKQMLGARGQMKSLLKRLRAQAWKRWQAQSQALSQRFRAEFSLLEQLGQRCLVSAGARLSLSWPNGNSTQATCANLNAVKLQFQQATQALMPDFAAFLRHQPKIAYLLQMQAQNRPFFEAIEGLLRRVKKLGKDARLSRSQLRLLLLREMADIQWFLSHLHGMLVGKSYSNSQRLRLFLSMSLDVARRLLKARRAKLSGQAAARIAKLQQRLEAFKQISHHLLEGNLSRVMELTARLLLQSRQKQEKAFRSLLTVVSYSDALRDTSPAGAQKRKQIIESLFEQANERKNRDGEWLLSLGLGLGLTTGYQWLAKNQADGYSGELAPPQLAIPSGFALEYWSSKNVGFHLFVFFADVGQFTSYELGKNAQDGTSQVNKPSIGSLFALGLHLGIAWGTPASPFILGFEARFSPTLFEAADGKRTGAARFGLFLGTHFHFFDFL